MFRCLKLDIAVQLIIGSSCDANVNYRSAFLDPVARHQTGFADRADQDVGLPRHLGGVSREFVRSRYGDAGKKKF